MPQTRKYEVQDETEAIGVVVARVEENGFSPLQDHFGEWVTDKVDPDFKTAKEREAFSRGAKYALALRMFHQRSPENHAFKAESREAREADAEERAEARAARIADREQKREEAEAAKAQRAQDRVAAREARAEAAAEAKANRPAAKRGRPAKAAAEAPAPAAAKARPAGRPGARKAARPAAAVKARPARKATAAEEF